MKTHLSQLEVRIITALKQSPRYGQELWLLLSQQVTTTSRSSTYEALHRLARLGYVVCISEASPMGPTRRRWRCSRKGLAYADTAWEVHRLELSERLRSVVHEYRFLMHQLGMSSVGEEPVAYPIDSPNSPP